jgi:hypothetical protein
MIKNLMITVLIIFIVTSGLLTQANNPPVKVLSPIQKEKPNRLSKTEKKDGWELLFNGKNFKNWRGYNRDDIPPVWIIENGTIKVEPSKKTESDNSSVGDIIFDRKFKDFELYFEWKITEGGNSGLFFLGQELPGKGIYRSAPEFQLLDNENHPDGRQGRDGNRKSASLYDMIPAVPQNANPAMQWNSGGIILKNGKVTHFQNGVKVVEYTLWTSEWLELIENSKFKGWTEMINVGGENKEGYIGLQYHGDEIWFRNIKIKEF